MFHADIFIFHPFCGLFRLDENLTEIAGSIGLLRAGSADRRDCPQLFFDSKTELTVIDFHFFEQRRDQPALLIG